jgi:hypothetical protein
VFIESYEMVVLRHQATVTFVPVRFAFASLSFLRCSFASTTVISHACCDSNFLICFLLRAEDRVEVGAVEVGAVSGSANSWFFFGQT